VQAAGTLLWMAKLAALRYGAWGILWASSQAADPGVFWAVRAMSRKPHARSWWGDEQRFNGEGACIVESRGDRWAAG